MKPPHPPSRHGGAGRPAPDRGAGGAGRPYKAQDQPRRGTGGHGAGHAGKPGKPQQEFGRQGKAPQGRSEGRSEGHSQGNSPGRSEGRSEGHFQGRPRDGQNWQAPRNEAGGSGARTQPLPRREQPSGQPRAAADAPRGTVWLYGTHAAAAALVNPSRRLRRLLLTEEAEASLAEHARPPWPVPHERVDRARLDQLLGRDVVHQGVALLADLLAPPGLAQTMQRPGPLLVLDQVGDPRNVGAILRSAAAFGVAGVVMQDRNAPEETGALAKAASGALETMPLLRAVNIARTLVALKAAGCWVVGLDAGASGPLAGPALAERRVALVLGAEGGGLRRLTRETCDEIAGLAMPGAMESLNVSAATAIALYELTRRG